MLLSRILSAVAVMFNGDYDKAFGGPLKLIAASQPIATAAAIATASPPNQRSLRLLSWNLLATPYVRPKRETEEEGLARARLQVKEVAEHAPDIVGLQEFWCSSDALVELWREFAEKSQYTLHVCQRVDGKKDGCALLLRAGLGTPAFTTYTYDDWGSRIIQQAEISVDGMPLVLLQTHLTFPHSNEHDPIMRRHQARKLAELARAQPAATVVFGDLNSFSIEDAAIVVLTTLGGCHLMPLREDSASHIAHTGELMACDMALTRGACRVGDWSLGGTGASLGLD